MQKDKSTPDSDSGDNGAQADAEPAEAGDQPEAAEQDAGKEAESEMDAADDTAASPESEKADNAEDETAESALDAEAKSSEATAEDLDAATQEDADSGDNKALPSPPPPPPPQREKPRRSWFGFFNFLLILGLAGAGGYYWYLQDQGAKQAASDYEATIAELRAQIAAKPTNAQLIDEVEPMRRLLGQFTNQITELETSQEALTQASEKLYELYGRNKNEWQLAEVEYLMRVAQHKLILQDDFAGAAITLQAASDLLGESGDPGMLPVRVMISEEIADLRTRKRADLVGMTLMLAQLSREVLVLQPGFAPRIDEAPEQEEEELSSGPEPIQGNKTWYEQIGSYVDSLVVIRHESLPPTEIEANIEDVGETLSGNLTQARWAVLERDVYHYELLLERSVQLFREYYDLDNAANADFLQQLTDLQKRVLKPEKPDITGSLREMQRILQRRDLEPAEAPEATDG